MSPPDSHVDTVVIGSGAGGLGAAALLSRAGKKVLVLEQHYALGGLTHTFRRGAFEWDVGLHYLGQVHRRGTFLQRVFELATEGALSFAPMPAVYDRAVYPDRKYDFVTGVGPLTESLVEAFPRERRAIQDYLGLIRRIAKLAWLYFPLRATSTAARRALEPVIGRGFSRWARRTTLEVLRTLTSDARLIGVLTSQWGNYGVPPGQSSFAMHALVADYYLNGGSYPVGGSARVADTMAAVVRRHGGELRTSACVEEILLDQRGQAAGVRLRSGETISADAVVSNAGVVKTMTSLLPSRPDLAQRATVEPSLGHLCLYLGLDSADAAEELGGTNIWAHAGYDHDRSLGAFLRNPSAPLPLVYVSSGSEKDPSWRGRHPGRSTITAICPAKYEWFAKYRERRWRKRGPEYEALKAEFESRLRERVVALLPGIASHVVHSELSTPLSTEHFVHRPGGAIYGLAHTPARFQLPWLGAQTPVRNLFLAGQDVLTVGVGSSLISGFLVAMRIAGPGLIKNLTLGARARRGAQKAITI